MLVGCPLEGVRMFRFEMVCEVREMLSYAPVSSPAISGGAVHGAVHMPPL